jgi:hypothetical protein
VSQRSWRPQQVLPVSWAVRPLAMYGTESSFSVSAAPHSGHDGGSPLLRTNTSTLAPQLLHRYSWIGILSTSVLLTNTWPTEVSASTVSPGIQRQARRSGPCHAHLRATARRRSRGPAAAPARACPGPCRRSGGDRLVVRGARAGSKPAFPATVASGAMCTASFAKRTCSTSRPPRAWTFSYPDEKRVNREASAIPGFSGHSRVKAVPHWGHLRSRQGCPTWCGTLCPQWGQRQLPPGPAAFGPPIRPGPWPRPLPPPCPGPVPLIMSLLLWDSSPCASTWTRLPPVVGEASWPSLTEDPDRRLERRHKATAISEQTWSWSEKGRSALPACPSQS